jgi:hypothetical protein
MLNNLSEQTRESNRTDPGKSRVFALFLSQGALLVSLPPTPDAVGARKGVLLFKGVAITGIVELSRESRIALRGK